MQATSLGQLSITFRTDLLRSKSSISTQIAGTPSGIAPEVAWVVGALLFVDYQIRNVNEANRAQIVEQAGELCKMARRGPVADVPQVTEASVQATFDVRVAAVGSGMNADVREDMRGLVRETCSTTAAILIVRQGLATLTEPYRSVFREAIEAALDGWRVRRPSILDESWSWPTLLRRLDTLVRQGVVPNSTVERERCPQCNAARPPGAACLHCGAAPSTAAPSVSQPPLYQPPQPRPAESQTFTLTTEEPVSVAPAPPIVQPPSVPRDPQPAPQPAVPEAPPYSVAEERGIEPPGSILPATPDVRLQEMAGETAKPEEFSWPFAGPGRRILGLAIDLIVGLLAAFLLGFGVTALVQATGGFGPGDDPRSLWTIITLIALGLYFWIGWSGGETLAMTLLRMQLVRGTDRKRAGIIRALRRLFGVAVLLVAAAAIFYFGNQIDNNIPFIQGIADLIVRIVIGLIALAVLVSGYTSLFSDPERRIWPDKVAGTLVLRKR